MSRKNDTLNYTDELKYSLNIMHEQSKFAETKNASMIVFTSALFVGILANVDAIKSLIIFDTSRFPVFKDNSYKAFIIIFLFTLIISFIISIISFLPKIGQKSVERGKTRNLLFFDENITFTSSEELEEYYSNKYKNKELFNKDIANQILNLSKIAKSKYVFFKVSAWTCVFGFIMSCVVAFAVWYFS